MNLVGETLNQYQITELVGEGGMAKVYRAYQAGLDRDVAIKVLPVHFANTADFIERFSREARAVAQLSHPNIMPIYDMGVQDDLSYFVMKYVPGRTLGDLLGHPMDLTTVCRYVDQIAGALDHAHTQGIIHRDIKPSNMLMEEDWLLLADFGLAKTGLGRHNLTGTGTVMGTPTYLAPEQGEGREIDHRADIYSLGVVLYEMLTGRVPFEADTPMGLIFKHVYEPLPPPRSINSHISLEIEQIVLKALDKNKDNRYDQAGELAQALRDQLHNASTLIQKAPDVQPSRIFISYKRNSELDQNLANFLYNFFANQGHEVFIDRTMRTGDVWMEEIDHHIKESDFIIPLLSEASANSEMVQAEIRRAYEHRKRQGHPHTLPVRVAFEDLLPYSVDAFLDPLQYVVWHTDTDNDHVAYELLEAIAGRALKQAKTLVQETRSKKPITYSEDGRPITNNESLHAPLPEFDPRILDALETPGGVVKLRDKFYIERKADVQLQREVIKMGTTTTIRASRQTGKSSLLVRGVHYAKKFKAKIVNLDLQRVDGERMTSPDIFLRDLAELIVRKLRLDVSEVENFWSGSLGPQDKLTYMLEDYVLPETETSIILALDEVDRLLNFPFATDFFALLRSWHNSRALDEEWDKLNIIMVISTEPYQLISDVNQSPFNVGLKLYLEDFTPEQVTDLHHRYGDPVTDNDFDQMIKLLGGHPYLTRKALYTIVADETNWADLKESATLDHGPFGDHLRRHQWLLRDETELQAALKQVIDHEQCTDEMSLFRLLQAGLVKGSGDVYTCRCDLYRIYFKDKL